MLNRCQRHSTSYNFPVAIVRHCHCNRRELSDGLVLEELLGREFKARLVGPGDDLNTQDRVATQLKEVVVDAYLLKFQDAGPDLRQCLFSRRSWRDVTDGQF